MRKGGRTPVFTHDGIATEQPAPLDDIVNNLMITGSVNEVVDQILELNEKTGGFGELVYAGVDWTDPVLAKRSMILMAEQVMPKVNQALSKS